jgi:hypothetical protein
MELRSLSPVLGSPRVGASLPRPTLVPTTATTHRAYLTGLPVIGALSPSHVSKPCLSEPRTPRSSARRGHSAVSRSRVMVLGLGSSSGASLSTEAWLPVQTNIAQGRQGHPVQRRRPRGSTSGSGQDGAELRPTPTTGNTIAQQGWLSAQFRPWRTAHVIDARGWITGLPNKELKLTKPR